MQSAPQAAARPSLSVTELDKVALRQWLDTFSSDLAITNSLVSVAADVLQEHIPCSKRDDIHFRNLDLLTIIERMTKANLAALEHLINNPPTVQDQHEEESSNC